MTKTLMYEVKDNQGYIESELMTEDKLMRIARLTRRQANASMKSNQEPYGEITSVLKAINILNQQQYTVAMI
ncbi:hypothetical protein MHZ36_13865 [Staphylococcus sp. ACRSN]|uniref:hypothetical protein n=1 Tax=Staphylococcus TaxID=1279 RepID=UPI0011C856C8|nr:MULTISPECIES: hypothetical protein [Staphylococcus]MCG7340345.1 hypothetical protein [Staphylococcus sp. ACRSN]